MDAVILAEKVVDDMDLKTLVAFATETLIGIYGELSAEELTRLAESLGYDGE